MEAVLTEPAADAVNVEHHARIVMDLLREYAKKLAQLNEELLSANEGAGYTANRAAWLLDQSEVTRKPLMAILSRGSGLREGSPLESITRDELSLRMFETEVHLHHMLRLAHQLRERITSAKLTEQVAKLRLSAGLNAMKGGPLKPDG